MEQTSNGRERLLDAMIEADVSPQLLAEKTGLTVQTIYRILRGHRCFRSTGAKIAKALRKRVGELELVD